MSVVLSIQNQPSAPPSGPSAVILLDVTARLTALIEDEIAALTADSLRDISNFQDEKNKLAAAYGREMALVRLHPDQVAMWSDEVIDDLREATTKFTEVLKRHVQTLDRVKSVTETVLRSIGKQVAQRTRPVIGYGKDAGLRQSNARAPISLAYDQAI